MIVYFGPSQCVHFHGLVASAPDVSITLRMRTILPILFFQRYPFLYTKLHNLKKQKKDSLQ